MIFLKRKVVFAYAITCSSVSIGLVIWVLLFIAAQQPENNMVAEDLVWAKDIFPNNPHHHPGLERHKDGGDRYETVRLSNTGPVLIPNNTQLRLMSWAQLSVLYHRYLSDNQYQCGDIQRMGKVTDGGWDLCIDSRYRPRAPCVVYSFGVGDDFSFDDAMASTFDCHLYSFDPSMKMRNTKRGEKKYFYRQGLADSDRILPNGWEMMRIESIRAFLKHHKTPIHTVKLDIEEWEWEVLPDLLSSDFLSAVTQLLVEFHQCDGCSQYNPDQEDKEPSRDRYLHMLELLHQLYHQKFRIFHHHHNKACNYLSKFTGETTSACSEIGFLRIS